MRGWMFLLSIVAVSALLAVGSAAGGDGMVPIKFSESFVPAGEPDVACGYGVYLPNSLYAQGTASHLGSVTTDISVDGCSLDPGKGVLYMYGSADHTAANGDTLHLTFDVDIDAATGVGDPLDVWFDGGTGRFENATGDATGSGVIDLGTGAGVFSYTGTISTVGFG